MKKVISVLLCIIILAGVIAVGASSLTASADNLPIIYVVGYGCSIARHNDDGSTSLLYPVDTSTDTILGYLTENKDVIIDAVLTQDWSEFDDKIYEIFTSMYEPLMLDNNGNISDGSYAEFNGDIGTVNYFYRNFRGVSQFEFHYDWRLDPYDNMAKLRSYVENVQQVTGSEDYAIVSRCMGCNLALTYMDVYKDPHLKKVVFYAGANYGASPVGEVFSGNLVVDPDAVARFMYCLDMDIEIPITDELTLTEELLREILVTLSDVYGLDFACWAVNNVYSQIYMDIIPRTMRKTLGSFPGYWSMVDDRYFDEAKKVVFGGMEDEYAGMIEKIDNYHSNIYLRQEKIIDEFTENGGQVFDVVKYGNQCVPVSPRSDELSDRVCFVSDTSFGATTSGYKTVFDDSYISALAAEGKDKYVSPDKRIDASTGLMPDTTWYINNLEHTNFDLCVNTLLEKMIYEKDFTVYSDPDYPQYLFYDAETHSIAPEEPEHSTAIDAWYETTNSFWYKLKPFFKIFYDIFCFFVRIFTFTRYN